MNKVVNKCELCNEQFNDKQSLNTHKWSIHKVKYGCDQCDRKYPELKSLKYHKTLVHGGRQYKCTKCHFISNSKDHLSNHKKLCTEPVMRYDCDQCKYSSARINHLHIHREKKHEISKYNCDLCDQATQNQKDLRNHMRIIHQRMNVEKEIVKIECSKCGKLCIRKDRIKRLKMIGLDRLNYTCKACETQYRSRNFINIQAIRKQERLTNVCAKCNHQAISRRSLRHHKYISHSSIRRDNVSLDRVSRGGISYPCDQCDYQFSFKIGLSRHKSIKHEGLRFMCELCDYNSTTLRQIRLHKECQHSGVNMRCDQCEFTSINRYGLKEHKKRKHEGLWYHCTVIQGNRNPVQCDYKTQFEKDLKKHNTTHHECYKCYFKATWKYQLDLHKQENKCEIGEMIKCGECDFSSIFRRTITIHRTKLHKNAKP